MVVPDKIYTDNRGVYAELPIFSQADANIEYIRKDALLGWAKDKIVAWDGSADVSYYKEFIDKLNSM